MNNINEEELRNKDAESVNNEENSDTMKEQEAEDTEIKEEKTKSGLFGKKNNSKEEKLKEQIDALTEEKNELSDRFLRLYSEFDNYKKRTQKERLELISVASEKVILDILPIVDDFERAIKANEKVDGGSSLKEGFELIYGKLIQMIKRNGVEEIQAMGADFDTDYHEAITHIPVPDEQKGKVVDVVEKGYKLHDKIIRFAKVVVGN